MVGILYDTDATDANNTAFAGISQAENVMKPSDVNNDFRAHDGATRRFLNDMGGTAVVSGTNTILVTLNQAFTAYGTSVGQIPNGAIISIKPVAANTSAATLNINSIGAKAIRLQGDSALVGAEMALGGIYLLRYDTAYNSAAGAWVLLNPAVSAPVNAALTSNDPYINLSLVASVGASALTVAIKGVDGNDPSATNVVYINFRSVTAGSGAVSQLAITAATSIVISSGSTMGFTSTVIGKLWLVGFNDAGTFRLGLVNCLSGTSIFALADGIYSSTAEGGSGGADSAQVIYTGTAVTSKAMTVLGYLEATEATAGTWATAPSLVQVRTPSTPLPGTMIQSSKTQSGASSSGTTVVPVDNTIPQNSEGDQYFSRTLTPSSGANILRITAQIYGSLSIVNFWIMALFRDSTANALTAAIVYNAASNGSVGETISHEVLAGSASSTTLNLRAGPGAAGALAINNANGGAILGGVLNSYLQVQEIVT